MRRLGTTLLTVILVALAACASDGVRNAESSSTVARAEATTTSTTSTIAATSTTPPPPDPRDQRPYAFGTRTLTFVDSTRPTAAADGELPERTLETTLYLPVGEEPVPLIIFSHGFGGNPNKFERLLGAWAAAGYAVAAVKFPLTNDTLDPAQRMVVDVANQPGDVSFVLDQLLASDLAARFDTDRLATAGLSLGGLTTYIGAVDEATRDPRFRAAIVMAAVPPGEAFTPYDMPILVMHGQLDPVVPVALATATYALLPAPAYLVTMPGALHAEAFEDAEDNEVFPDRERFHPVVDATTVAFWDTYLLSVQDAEPEIATAADRPGISTVESRQP